MAQQKREKELNANNSNNASGDFVVNEGSFNDDGGNFQYPNGYYYGPGGDVQQTLPPADIYYGGDGMIERRRHRSDSRGVSRRHGRQTSSSSRRRVSQRRSSAARNEAFVQAVS